MTDIIINEIKKARHGILVINKNKVVFHNKTKTFEGNLGGLGFEEFILNIADIITDIKIKSHVLKENTTAVVIIGEINRTLQECQTISKMFNKVGIKSNVEETISSIVGFQYTEQYYITKTITLPSELAENIDEIFSSGEYSSKNGFKNISQLVTALLNDVLGSTTHNFKAKSQMDNELLDMTIIINRFPRCNICNSFACIHVKKLLKDETLMTELKKKGISLAKLEIVEIIEKQLKDIITTNHQ